MRGLAGKSLRKIKWGDCILDYAESIAHVLEIPNIYVLPKHRNRWPKVREKENGVYDVTR